LDLQSEPGRERPLDQRIHAFRFSTQRFVDRALRWIGFRLRLDRLSQFLHRNGHADASAHGNRRGVRPSPFFITTGSSGKFARIDAAIARLDGGTSDASQGGLLPGWALHGTKWAVAFVLPLSAMWFGKVYRAAPATERNGYVAADLPNSARAHFNYGSALQQQGQLDAAQKEYAAALRFDANYTKVFMNLGQLFVSKGKLSEAKENYERAIQLEPHTGRNPFRFMLILLERLAGRMKRARNT